MSVSVNRDAVQFIDRIISSSEKLDCAITEMGNGCTLIDAGVQVTGSLEAGRLISEACLGGLGVVRFTETPIGDRTLPSVTVMVDQPKIATLGSQYSGWTIKKEDFFGMGSGPARALAGVEKVFTDIGYRDDAEVGTLLLEARQLPSEEVTTYIAEKCGISPSDLSCIVAPTASIVGSVQISARVVEVGMHKLYKLGLDPEKVRKGYGVAPIAPVAKNDNRAMGMTNDCILYGGRTYYSVRADPSDDLAELVKKAPSSSSQQYGRPFYDIFKGFNYDFYQVDPLLFSPAEITLIDLDTGKVYKSGAVDADILQESLTT
jgi:methenyltetrahydromethanopterin cyclohydrolase